MTALTLQSQNNNHYFTLGLTQAASKGDIKAAFRYLALITHPDKGGNAADFRQIRTAYDVLKDDLRRKHYDQTLPRFVPRPAQAKAPSPPPYSPLRPEDFRRRLPKAAPTPARHLYGGAETTASTPSRPGTPGSADGNAWSDDEPEQATSRKESAAHDVKPSKLNSDEHHYVTCPLPVEKCALCHFVPLRWCTSKISAELLAEARRERTMTEAQKRAKKQEAESKAKREAEKRAERVAGKQRQKKSVAESAAESALPDAQPATPAPIIERKEDPATPKRVTRWYPFRSANTSPVYIQRARVYSELQAAMEAEAAFGSVAW